MDGRFELKEVLGAGACAVVCIARRRSDPPDAPPIALKVLKEDRLTEADIVRRFRDEGRILQHLDHPGIVRVYGMHDYNGRLVLEMECVRGASLERILGAHGPVPTAVALAVIRSSAEALDVASETPDTDGRPMRIVHRDLKPANIAIGIDGRVMLLDFGYAKADFAGRSADSMYDVWGTLGYDAPERKQGPITQKADVYALGVTLYVALTQQAMILSRKVDHHDSDVQHALGALKSADYADLDGLKSLITDTLRHDPQARPSMKELIARVDALMPTGAARAALDAFVTRTVQGLWDDRGQAPLESSRYFQSLRFLQEVGPTPPMDPLDAGEGESRLRALLVLPDWPRRVSELELLLDACPDLGPGPFVEVLSRATVPRWKFWVRASTVEQVEASLLLLRRLNATLAAEHGTRLSGHASERVRRAATYVAR